MKNRILIPLLIVGALVAFFSFKYIGRSGRSSEEKRQLVINKVMEAIQHEHFSPRNVDDSFSVHVFNKMFDWFDGGKIFFTKQDVERLKPYQYKIDDEIKAGSIEFFDTFDAMYIRRTTGAEKYYKEILAKPFTFTANEKIQTDPAKEDFADGDAGLAERWRQNLKYRVLARFVDLKTEQEKKAKDSTGYKMRPDDSLEVQARDDVRKQNERYFKRMDKMKDDDRFTLFVNQIAETEDPHTEYFPPVEKTDFDVMMSGSFFGIGARLKQDNNDHTIITDIVTGSPSWKQGELKADDEIIKVAQGDKPPVDIQGFDINDVIKLIRGDKGTEVRLTVKKADGTIKVIPIIRDVVNIEETFAKSAIIKSGDSRIGYIYLPEFYADFNHTSGRRCATDVREEVKKLKAEGVTGIILDLRGNGGGSLADVVEMSGLFVGKGPVVQVKNSRGGLSTMRPQMYDTALYSGPMAIMVNEGSASASEILAAAMQDYKRAVIVGEPTYGKGTVQKMIPLDELLNPMTRIQMQNDTTNGDPSLGELKLTMEKFYRVSGGSTQLKGVVPDISLPDVYDYIDDEDLGERKNKSALAYDEIAPANYKPVYAYADIKTLQQMSNARVEANPTFKLIQKNAADRKAKMDDRTVSLNEKQFRKEQEEMNNLSKQLEDLQKKGTPLDVINATADMKNVEADSSSIAKNKEWLKRISKDIYISETVNIVNDISKSGMSVNNPMRK